MFTKNRRRIAELEARVKHLSSQRDEERTHRNAAVSGLATSIGHAAADHRRYVVVVANHRQRMVRLIRAVVRYRAELAAAERRARLLQARLDDAVGLDCAAIYDGVNWQIRREDKPKASTA
jgi:hypothetical protein